jgi:hypothetical protein
LTDDCWPPKGFEQPKSSHARARKRGEINPILIFSFYLILRESPSFSEGNVASANVFRRMVEIETLGESCFLQLFLFQAKMISHESL